MEQKAFDPVFHTRSSAAAERPRDA